MARPVDRATSARYTKGGKNGEIYQLGELLIISIHIMYMYRITFLWFPAASSRRSFECLKMTRELISQYSTCTTFLYLDDYRIFVTMMEFFFFVCTLQDVMYVYIFCHC